MDKTGIQTFINQVRTGDNINAQETFSTLIGVKASDALESMKREVAGSMFQTEGYVANIEGKKCLNCHQGHIKTGHCDHCDKAFYGDKCTCQKCESKKNKDLPPGV